MKGRGQGRYQLLTTEEKMRVSSAYQSLQLHRLIEESTRVW